MTPRSAGLAIPGRIRKAVWAAAGDPHGSLRGMDRDDGDRARGSIRDQGL